MLDARNKDLKTPELAALSSCQGPVATEREPKLRFEERFGAQFFPFGDLPGSMLIRSPQSKIDEYFGILLLHRQEVMASRAIVGNRPAV